MRGKYLHFICELGTRLARATTDEDKWIGKTAKTVEVACGLVKAGSGYVIEIEGLKLFRKRK